jgi:signal transduction histidine kinase
MTLCLLGYERRRRQSRDPQREFGYRLPVAPNAEVPSAELALGRFALRFISPATEVKYREWHAREAMPFTRVTYGAVLLVVMPVAMLGAWFAVPEVLGEVACWLLALTSLAVVGLAATYRPWMVRWMGLTSVVNHAAITSGFVLVSFNVLHRPDLATGSTVVGSLLAFSILRMHLHEALFAVLPYFAIDEALMVRSADMGGTAGAYTCLNVIALMTGVVAAWMINRSSRESYRQRSDLRESNRALATSNLELLEIDRLRDALVTNVTHDLRTPLTAIKGAADNLLDGIAGPLSDDQREYVEIVREHAVRLAATVSEILQAARLTAGQVELNQERLDVAAIVDEVQRGLAPLARERGIRLDVRTRMAHAPADREKLRRAVENLVSNAIKFTDDGGEVIVEVAPHEDVVEIAVRDTGHGIAADELPRLFERFYRGSARKPGTGLGLSIARNLVRLHGGEISVTSEVGRGSEFRVRLPRELHRLPVLGAT